MSEPTILASLDSADLLSRGLLGPGKTTGSQRLHKRRLNRFSDEEYKNIPLNVSLSSPTADDAFALIPTVLVSYETLIYVGLTEAKATEMWNRWSTTLPVHGVLRETDPDDDYGMILTFDDFIIASFENQVDTWDEDDEQPWRACLDDCGIATNVQNSIMDPHFEDLRLSQSCLYWINDTIKMRYAGLEEIQRTSHRREMQLRRLVTHPDGSQGESEHDDGQGGPNIAPGSSSSTSQAIVQ